MFYNYVPKINESKIIELKFYQRLEKQKKNHIVAPQEQLSLDISNQFKNNLAILKLSNLNLSSGKLNISLGTHLISKNNFHYFNSNLTSYISILKVKKSR